MNRRTPAILVALFAALLATAGPVAQVADPQTEFLHLYGTPEVIGRRQASRPGHFMPASLLQSQFDTLEPLDPDEGGLAIDVDQGVDSIVDDYVSRTGQEN